VPNYASTTCLIQVMDYNATCKYDNSNAVFTIQMGLPILTAPNGGEVWWAGINQNITWNINSIASGANVKLEYSTNNGSTWNLITASTTNDGTEPWFVANANSTQCLVKITSLQNNLSDISNAVFTIKPAVSIISPNGSQGGTLWGGCSNTSITFDRSLGFNSYLIEYSLNNGTTWTTIINNWTTSSNPASYSWNIPNVYGTQCLVRVTPVGYSSYSDQSDNVFTIVQPVIVTKPNTNTTLTIGSTYSINWINNANSSIYDIFYSTKGSSTWNTIVTAYTTTANTYSWTVPNTPSTNCLVKVRDNLNSCKEDVSDVAFIIGTGGGGNQTCNTYTSTDVPKNIVDNQTVASILSISATGTITDVNIKNLGITHTYTSDLTVKLKKSTTTVTVLSSLCGSENNILLNFDDESYNAYSSIPCPATNNGNYKPQNSLTAFDGLSVNGTWTLEVSDGAGGDIGTLNSWKIEVCYQTAGGKMETVEYVYENNANPISESNILSAKVFPNPFTDNIQIVIDENELLENNVIITNVLGEVVYNGQINNKSSVINTDSFKNGIYIITITNSEKSYQTKMVKNK